MKATKTKKRTKRAAPAVRGELLTRPTFRHDRLSKGTFGLLSVTAGGAERIYYLLPLGRDATAGFVLACCSTGERHELDTSGGRSLCGTCSGRCVAAEALDAVAARGGLS